MIPSYNDVYREDEVYARMPSFGFRYNTTQGLLHNDEVSHIAGVVDERESVSQAVFFICNTERYAYSIFNNDEGIELEQFFGEPFSYFEAKAEYVFRDALLQDDRITDITIIEITQPRIDVGAIRFIVHSVYGDIEWGHLLDVNRATR